MSSDGTYQPNWTSRNRLQIENAYRSSGWWAWPWMPLLMT